MGVVVAVVIVYWLWWWHRAGGGSGDIICKGGRCKSFRSALVKCMMCGKSGVDCVGGGYGDCGGICVGCGQKKYNH